MAKIKTSKLNRADLTVQFDTVAIVFDNNLQAEIEDSLVELVMSEDPSISLVTEEKEIPREEITEEDPTTGDLEEDLTTSTTENQEVVATQAEEVVEEESTGKVESELGSLTVTELQAICKEAELPEKAWKSLKKPELISYLESKLNK